MKSHYSSRSLLKSGLLLYCRKWFYHDDLQHLTLILDLCVPKNGNKGLTPKNYCLIEQLWKCHNYYYISGFVDESDLTYFTLTVKNLAPTPRLKRP